MSSSQGLTGSSGQAGSGLFSTPTAPVALSAFSRVMPAPPRTPRFKREVVLERGLFPRRDHQCQREEETAAFERNQDSISSSVATRPALRKP